MKFFLLTYFILLSIIVVSFFIKKDKAKNELTKEKNIYKGKTRQEVKEILVKAWKDISFKGTENWLNSGGDEKWLKEIREKGNTINEELEYLWNNRKNNSQLLYFDNRDGWKFDFFNYELKKLGLSIKNKNVQDIIKEIQND